MSKTIQTDPGPEPTMSADQRGNGPPQLKLKLKIPSSSQNSTQQAVGSNGLDLPDMSAEALGKPVGQGETRVDSIINIPGNSTAVPHDTPARLLPQGTPAANTAEGILYAAHKRKRNEDEDPLSRFAKYSKAQIENQLSSNFQIEHGYKPGYHELHDTEIRRGIPPEDRVWTTIEEQVLIDQGLRPKEKFLGGRMPGDPPEED